MRKPVPWITVYTALTALVVLAYVTTREYLISTPLGYVIVSNLTLNYVLFTFLLGGVAGWLAWTRLFKRWGTFYRVALTMLACLFVAGLWLVVAQMGGYKLR